MKSIRKNCFVLDQMPNKFGLIQSNSASVSGALVSPEEKPGQEMMMQLIDVYSSEALDCEVAKKTKSPPSTTLPR